jgi:hypothetical protein
MRTGFRSTNAGILFALLSSANATDALGQHASDAGATGDAAGPPDAEAPRRGRDDELSTGPSTKVPNAVRN